MTSNTNTTSRIKVDGSAPTNDLLVKFVVPTSCTPTSATLLLTVGSGGNDPSSRGGDFYATSPNDPNAGPAESTVTWERRRRRTPPLPPVSLAAGGGRYHVPDQREQPGADRRGHRHDSWFSISADGARLFLQGGQHDQRPSTPAGLRLAMGRHALLTIVTANCLAVSGCTSDAADSTAFSRLLRRIRRRRPREPNIFHRQLYRQWSTILGDPAHGRQPRTAPPPLPGRRYSADVPGVPVGKTDRSRAGGPRSSAAAAPPRTTPVQAAATPPLDSRTNLLDPDSVDGSPYSVRQWPPPLPSATTPQMSMSAMRLPCNQH